MTKINVLDKGYVTLVDSMGDDLSSVNAARASYDKSSSEFSERDQKLLNFLVREKHMSVFRHASMTFEVYAPLMVARQWFKYAVASAHLEDQQGWNESSRRYITEEPAFYLPGAEEWRTKPENSKQGSGEPLESGNDISDWMFSELGSDRANYGRQWTQELEDHIARSEKLYEDAMNSGICAEQARLFLPAYGMYVRWRWTTSLATVLHFLAERLEHDAQKEIQDYAKAVLELVRTKFPKTLEAVGVA
jgi:thymidylate synthase (FAD)